MVQERRAFEALYSVERCWFTYSQETSRKVNLKTRIFEAIPSSGEEEEIPKSALKKLTKELNAQKSKHDKWLKKQ